MAVASGVIGPDAAGGDQLRDAQVEVGGAGGRLAPRARARRPSTSSARASAPPKISSGPSRRSSACHRRPSHSVSARARSSAGAAAATASAASACVSCTRPSASGGLVDDRREVVGADAGEQEPAAGGRDAAAAGLDGGDRRVLDHLDPQVVREVGADPQVGDGGERLTASRSACASTCRVLMPSATEVRASRTCSDSELVLPVIETCSTLANEESRNHRPAERRAR